MSPKDGGPASDTFGVRIGDVIMARVNVGRGGIRVRECVVEEVRPCPVSDAVGSIVYAIGRYRTIAGCWSRQRRVLLKPWARRAREDGR